MLRTMKRPTMNRKPSGRREDGAATKQQILEAAGEIFAEKGVGYATGKEIAERAKTNSAAVNYYFGGIEGLYSEVLIEAHHRLMDYEFLKTLDESPSSPKEKLELFVEGILRTVLGPLSSSWALRVLGREMLHPSESYKILLEKEILPKRQIGIGFISQILRLPPEHPIVSRTGLNIMGPILFLVASGPEMLKVAAPGTSTPRDVDALVAHFLRFVAGGLNAVIAGIDQDTSVSPLVKN